MSTSLCTRLVVPEHIAEQNVDVPVTIPQERVSERTVKPTSGGAQESALLLVFWDTPGSSSSTPAPDSAPDPAVELEKVRQRIKLRQVVEAGLAERAAQELLQRRRALRRRANTIVRV